MMSPNGIRDALLLAVSALLLIGCSEAPRNPVIAGPGDTISIMAFDTAIPLSPPPPGWWQRKFWFTDEMKLSFSTIDAVPALRCETDNSASLFGRYTDIAIADFPLLRWQWLVDGPVLTPKNEETAAGDDHPARLYLRFKDEGGGDHDAEIIWGNTGYKIGDYIILENFTHYVANGGETNVGKWQSQEVDLAVLYAKASGRTDHPRLVNLAIFCDTDNTGLSSSAYFGAINLVKRGVALAE
jgi:Protein of unknown function (DUF3047)